eukprot:TRINITY_DN15995_c0_g1_i14.p1 TRINITY_DN15995_c0_g1~~TRINITY_DN15995_c0_g1_i14.p1  ORF type:complete len:144 (-),score=22.56 TRINITY_DN15995_c0_g1_i14:98-475(-)
MADKDLYDIRKNCVMTISIVINKVEDVEVLKGLVCAEVVETLSKMLSGNDIAMLLEVMEALNKLLEYGQSHFTDKDGVNLIALKLDECSGLTSLEALQEHPNTQVSEKAISIIEIHFGYEDEANN